MIWHHVKLKDKWQTKEVMANKVWGRKEWLVIEKWLDSMEDVGLSKNGKTRTIVRFKTISKNKSGIGMSRKVFKKK